MSISDTATPKTTKGQHFAPEVLTEVEFRGLLKACSGRAPTGIRNRALLVAMYRGGLRVSEALALKPGDVDPERGTVRVLHGKGDRSRVVGLDDGAMAIIQRWMDHRRTLQLRNGPLFCTLAGTHVLPSYVRTLMRRIAGKAGIEKRVHPHGLRHSHAADLVADGVPVNLIQQQLGHANLSVTDRYLRHVAPGDVIAMGRARKPFRMEEN
ncbi:MAG: tyrosine-type recombinase/integrase [Candidatus Dormibacteraeota bacterium]|nr:tyrosine-type recombinase/integrase [Candidatus Dormibacteraeota bacterium]